MSNPASMYAASMYRVAVHRPKILMMILGGVLGAAAAGAVSAATPQEDVPRLVVRYSADSLATDSGARALYRRLVHAAEQVCPDYASSGRIVSSAVQHCRAQSLARAVHEIDSPRLAQVYASNVRRG